MNLLLFEQHELKNSRLHLASDDRRSIHIKNILDLHVGDTLSVGMVNGAMGIGSIVSAGKDGVEIDVSLAEEQQDTRNIILILALPRPIMLQRILKQATVLGVKTFHLIRSEKVQKSYFQSKVLEKDNIQSMLLQGLEQAMDTRLPEVHVHHRFKPFVEDVVPALDAKTLLVAHPEANPTLADLYHQGAIIENIALAIGPEGGWNDFEMNLFKQKGFLDFSVGSRIMHVDTAVLILLAQLMLLHDFAEVRF